MVEGFYAHCGHRDRDQTRDAGCLPTFSLEIKPRRLFAHNTITSRRLYHGRRCSPSTNGSAALWDSTGYRNLLASAKLWNRGESK